VLTPWPLRRRLKGPPPPHVVDVGVLQRAKLKRAPPRRIHREARLPDLAEEEGEEPFKLDVSIPPLGRACGGNHTEEKEGCRL